MSEDHQLGDAPIEAAYKDKMNRIAQALDLILNSGTKGNDRKIGWVLMVFQFGDHDGDRCNYISNANRQDVVTMMKEQIKRFEGQPELKGTA